MWRAISRLGKIIRLVPVVLASALAGCAIGPQHELTTGKEPRYEDKDVRFQTVYYFRVFDYCDDIVQGERRVADDSRNIFAGVKDPDRLRLLKDSIYRFRMTGKASSLFSKIHFESGTLLASQIDPFGANVAFDETNQRFYFKSQQATEADARRDESSRLLNRYLAQRDKLPAGDPLRAELENLALEELRAQGGSRQTRLQAAADAGARLAKAMVEANEALQKTSTTLGKMVFDADPNNDVTKAKTALLGKYGGAQTYDTTSAKAAFTDKMDGQIGDGLKKASGDIKTYVDLADEAAAVTQQRMAELQAKINAANDPANKTQLADLQAAMAELRKHQEEIHRNRQIVHSVSGALRAALRDIAAVLVDAREWGSTPDGCGDGLNARRGFQILGPEGLRTFNQDERLIMAMSSDAKPLVGVLQELSSRVLTQKTSAADDLLPITQERLSLSEARRTLDAKVATADSDTVAAAIEAILAAFDRGPASRLPGASQ